MQKQDVKQDANTESDPTAMFIDSVSITMGKWFSLLALFADRGSAILCLWYSCLVQLELGIGQGCRSSCPRRNQPAGQIGPFGGWRSTWKPSRWNIGIFLCLLDSTLVETRALQTWQTSDTQPDSTGHRFRFDVVSCEHIKIFQEYLHLLAWSPVCRPDASASVWKCKLDQVRSIEVCLLFILSNWPDPQYTTCDTWNSIQFTVFTEVKKATEDKCSKCNSQT